MKLSAQAPREFAILALTQILLVAGVAQATSLVDAKFKLSRRSHDDMAAENELNSAYQEVFSKSMYSQCQWFPTDSQYLKLATKKCGPGVGTVLAVSRFMNEYDAALFNTHAVKDRDHLHFVDFGIDCGQD